MTLTTKSCEEEVTYHYRFLVRRGGPPIIHPGKHPHYKYIILQYTPSNDTPHFFVTSKKTPLRPPPSTATPKPSYHSTFHSVVLSVPSVPLCPIFPASSLRSRLLPNYIPYCHTEILDICINGPFFVGFEVAQF